VPPEGVKTESESFARYLFFLIVGVPQRVVFREAARALQERNSIQLTIIYEIQLLGRGKDVDTSPRAHHPNTSSTTRQASATFPVRFQVMAGSNQRPIFH
jgi:hypothetical protein